jgi:glutamate-1-semialdehyde 2,1-aminomutase
LATFGKAMANGFSVAALTGQRDLMQLGGIHHSKPRVFLLSTTNGGETHELAAALKSLSILREGEVTAHVWRVGTQLRDGFNEASASLGLNSRVFMAGPGCSPYQVFLNSEGNVDYNLRTLYLQEMVKEGVLIPYVAPSLSHSADDVERTLTASCRSLDVVRLAIERGTVEGLLIGPVVKPVFRQYN